MAFDRAKTWARHMRREGVAVSIAIRDPRTPWYARALGALVVAYALSPIDLIPDFIPVLGYLDDLLIVPLGIWLVVRLVPGPVLEEARARTDDLLQDGKPRSYAGAAMVVVIWIVVAVAFAMLFMGCSGKDAQGLVVERSTHVGQVAVVSWTTSEPGRGAVAYGLGAPDEAETPRGPSTTEHRVAIVGLEAGRRYDLRPSTAFDSGEVVEHEGLVFESEAAPGLLPTPIVTGEGGGWTLMGVDTGELAWPVIVDAEGHYVWIGPTVHDRDVLHAQPSGDAILYDLVRTEDEEGEVMRTALDGSASTSTPTPVLHHDVTELSDGTLAYLHLDARAGDIDGVHYDEIAGDAIREVHPDSPDDVHEVMTFWDALELSVPCFHFDGQAFGLDNDWTHMNSLTYREEDDAYLVMSRNFDALFAIDRTSGAVLWQMGGAASDFTLLSGTWWDHGHFSSWVGDELLVFDNGYHRLPTQSRVVAYRVDTAARTLEEILSATHPAVDFVSKLGDATLLANGHVLSSWTTAGRVVEMDATGEILWGVELPGTEVTRVSRLDDLDPVE